MPEETTSLYLIDIGYRAGLIESQRECIYMSEEGHERLQQLVPSVRRVEPRDGRFLLKKTSRIVATDNATGIGELLARYIRPATSFPLPVVNGSGGGKSDIFLGIDGDSESDGLGFYDESYTCRSGDEGCSVRAESDHGLARGIQTLRQLFPPSIFSASPVEELEWDIPACEIADKPVFKWRGMHLDVGRHFFAPNQVCRFLDHLALHRYNRLHLHLTEDQGWRIEIQKYPKLTEVGSVRDATLLGHYNDKPHKFSDVPYGGFYRQEEIRSMVAFAAERRVEIVPEIDMPGHMQAAIAAYPELGCTDMTIKPRCTWGISQHILNPMPFTMAFIKDVLDEVMELFPGKFIHIGGDEAHKYEWEESRAIQDRMVELGLKNEGELQSWFIGEIGNHILANGRYFIGWDEILEGGLAESAAIMSWRGAAGGISAARQNHCVVMAPNRYTYFDYYQTEDRSNEPLAIGNHLPVEMVLSYRPIPDELEERYHKYILGSQGQLWTEYIPTEECLDYMTYPRACALAEVLWSDGMDIAQFCDRLQFHRRRLDMLGINSHPKP